MKKILLSLITVLAINSYNAQQSSLIVNNYSIYDFKSSLDAYPDTQCYPSVRTGYDTQTQQVKVPANSHDGNGLQLYYKNFNDSNLPIFNGLYGIPNYTLSFSATATSYPASNSALLAAGTIVSNTVDWVHAKFQMYYAGTNTSVSGGTPLEYFAGNLGNGANLCVGGSTNISTSFGDAQWFTITGSGGEKLTYILLF